MSVKRGYQIVSHRPLCFWSVGDVEEWLRRRLPKLAVKYAELIRREGITGRVLVDMTEFQLLEIGIADVNDRRDLFLEICKERLISDSDELAKLMSIGSENAH